MGFSDKDKEQAQGLGLSQKDIQVQIERIRAGNPFVRLSRPCVLHDGIRALPQDQWPELNGVFEKAMENGRCSKFVPASGAASRMFDSLIKVFAMDGPIDMEELRSRAKDGDGPARDFMTFTDHIRSFAFWGRLEDAVQNDGKDIGGLIAQEEWDEILEYLLTEKGLDYANVPKGLVAFHDCGGEPRTAFAEQLMESPPYCRAQNGRVGLHFTIVPEYQKLIDSEMQKAASLPVNKGCDFDISYSVQKRSTDTIALGLDDQPLRDERGLLVFRPGGHGALLENLNDLKADIVFIKNIDNIAPDRLKPVTYQYKKLLAGYLVVLQEKAFSFLEKISGEAPALSVVEECLAFLEKGLQVHLNDEIRNADLSQKQRFARDRLDRPLRVCGMVKNAGEPGGGPAWVDRQGEVSLQIVESSQINMDDPQQKKIFESATHFNPVDIVCGLKDHEGKNYDLRRYVDPGACIVTQKPREGKTIKVLELPGLWNGGMADWNTVFVEVPIETFTPVKNFKDLLRKEHQAD